MRSYQDEKASCYSDFIGESPLSRQVGIDMNAGERWQTFWVSQPRSDWGWSEWPSTTPRQRRTPL